MHAERRRRPDQRPDVLASSNAGGESRREFKSWTARRRKEPTDGWTRQATKKTADRTVIYRQEEQRLDAPGDEAADALDMDGHRADSGDVQIARPNGGDTTRPRRMTECNAGRS